MPAPVIERAGGAATDRGAPGRRRAQLVQGIAHPAPAQPAEPEPRLSPADVAALQGNRSSEARIQLAAKFGRQYDSLMEDETRPLADAVLQLLMRDLEVRVRQTLAETLAESPKLPVEVARRLAEDDIEVARPILERSKVLSDEELGEIVRTHSMQYALAVAGREHLSEILSDILAETGESQVVARLVANVGAQISFETLQRVADDYKDDAHVRDGLVRRPALPYELVAQLVGLIGNRLEWNLVRKRRMTADEARRLMAATRERATLSIVAREHSERSVERELRQRLHEGDLGPEDVLTFLRNGEIARFETSFSLLADIDLVRIRQLLYGMDKRGLAALCARAGFGTPHYLAVRMTLDLAERGLRGQPADAEYSEETMRYVQQQYDRMRLDEKLMERLIGV